MKLSKTQREILARAARGDTLTFMDGLTSYFFWHGGLGGRHPRYDSVCKLLDLGFLEWYGESDRRYHSRVRISKLGREAVQAAEEANHGH